MKCIGIDQSTHDIYESSSNVWYSVWPANPIVSVVTFVDTGKDLGAFDNDLGRAEMVFREDSFDPVTRIRRGRFYQSSEGSRPAEHYVLFHPVYGNRGGPITVEDGRVERRLFTFEQLQYNSSQKIVAIGSGESLWRVLGVERITTGEYLVTLKARHALGVLPELNPDEIPEAGRKKVVETFEKLVDAAYRETPVSIIDRARDVAQWCTATWAVKKYNDDSFLCKDLASLIKAIDKKDGNFQIILSAARIVARLHSRGKPNEQEKHHLRPLIEADAEFALTAIGLLLREFHWVQ